MDPLGEYSPPNCGITNLSMLLYKISISAARVLIPFMHSIPTRFFIPHNGLYQYSGRNYEISVELQYMSQKKINFCQFLRSLLNINRKSNFLN